MNLPDFLLRLEFSKIAIVALLPLVFFLILFLHEMGHYIAARAMGMKVDDVHIGAGKILWRRKDRHGTAWVIGRWPLWAHVHIASFAWPWPVWKRFLVVLAGPAVNLVLPFFLFALFYVTFGQPATPAILSGVEVGHAADLAGMRPGDQVIAVNGRPVHHYAQVYRSGYDPEKETQFEVRRGNETLTFSVHPRVYRFVDTDGITRAYPRIGVIWSQKAFQLKIIEEVNGIETKGDSSKALSLLQKNFDRDVVIGLKSNDTKTHFYRTHPLQKNNLRIAEKKHKEYKMLFLGSHKDDFYYQGSFRSDLAEAGRDGLQLMGRIFTLPSQLLPINPDMLAPESAPYDDKTWLANLLYRLTYIGCLGSFLIGFVNLLPLPRLDGGVILFQAMEAWFRRPPTRRERALGLLSAFALIYFTILLFNFDNVPGYIDSRIKKVEEYMKGDES